MMEAVNISVRLGARLPLDNISLSVPPGKITVILGPNGAGKSTLLKALTGQARLAAGKILVDGESLPAWSPPELAARRAVLPQSSPLAFAFTVREVVLMGRMPHLQSSAKRNREIVAAALNGGEFGNVW